MIKANEFRIGNTVSLNSINYKNIQTEIAGIANIFFSCKEGVFAPENFEPIQLTEEILLKCGFEKHKPVLGSFLKTPSGTAKGYGFRFHTQYPFSKDNFLAATETYYMEQPIYVKCGLTYIHQLQNLYFALTGEELTVKL